MNNNTNFFNGNPTKIAKSNKIPLIYNQKGIKINNSDPITETDGNFFKNYLDKNRNLSLEFKQYSDKNEENCYSHVSTTSNSNKDEVFFSTNQNKQHLDSMQLEIKKQEAIIINLESEKNFWKNNFMTAKMKNEELTQKLKENEGILQKKKPNNISSYDNKIVKIKKELINPKIFETNESKKKISLLENQIKEWQKKYEELEKTHINEVSQLKLLMKNSQVSNHSKDAIITDGESNCASIEDEFIGNN